MNQVSPVLDNVTSLLTYRLGAVYRLPPSLVVKVATNEYVNTWYELRMIVMKVPTRSWLGGRCRYSTLTKYLQ
ncbi:hypothetical protein [Vulcanisaeta sp. EB80]|uniref:hypothetical protein n=1 Tax=Vulcanisaeta sp. EB80 TaxID=1650660 RepID=UPI0011813E76|nr:hypothetical protein [Vulcanisaeta sp. EB80]